MPAPSSATSVSIVVPACREGANLPTLIERVFAATTAAGIEAEMIIVDDDSQDETEAVVEESARRHPVRVIVRRDERGLSSAVLRGFREARHDCLLVMDADLQHPPESVPQLVRRLNEPDCDFVLGSRYVEGAGIAGNWPWHRRLNSLVAGWLARPLAPLSDPMSGFFALHRRTWEEADRLDPIGYKIGLELYVKGRCRRPAEVPIHFENRLEGVSKTTVAERVRYLRHLGRLYRYRFPWVLVVMALLVVGVTVGAWYLLTR